MKLNLTSSVTSSKSMTLKVIGILILAFIFILPAVVVKSIAREDERKLNSDVGRIWVFATHLTIPFFYLNVFPVWIILSNPKMLNSLKRDFIESKFGNCICKIFSNIKSSENYINVKI
jgi:hypothetical protein